MWWHPDNSGDTDNTRPPLLSPSQSPDPDHNNTSHRSLPIGIKTYPSGPNPCLIFKLVVMKFYRNKKNLKIYILQKLFSPVNKDYDWIKIWSCPIISRSNTVDMHRVWYWYRLWNRYEAIIQLNDNLIEWKLTRNQSTNLSAVIMLSNCQTWQSNVSL